MKRAVGLALLIVPIVLGVLSTTSTVARAQGAHEEHPAAAAGHEAAPSHGEGHVMDTPSFILHHVSDDYDWEFEIPWPGVEHNPTIHLGELTQFLQFEQVPGA